jgi:phage tail sheath protein FI
MSSNRVFVSPGVYTSEKDISFVTRQIGVTTLGLAGETTKGPAFQPIFVSNYNEFKSFFGGLDATIVKETGYAKYELPYIAKAYFAKSNQLYVTRVLGFSGYDAGTAWLIKSSSTSSDADKVVAVLRSRATYDATETLNPEVNAIGDLTISTSAATIDAEAEFTLSGLSQVTGNFTYNVSFDTTKKNYITRVLGTEAGVGQAPIFVEEIYENMLSDAIALSGITGISQTLATETKFNDYKAVYAPAISPYVVSEINGNVIKKLFRFITISDGDSANSEIKISIANIKPDDKEFDVYIRAWADTDARPIFYEKYARCNMDPTSANFVARRIGTLDGYYASKSNYVLLELDEDEDTSLSFPAGFTGVPERNYTAGTAAPTIEYNSTYGAYDKKRKIYLGISDTVGIDQDFFDYKGVATTATTSGFTNGFHMDSGATSNMLSGYTFTAGGAEFRLDADLVGGTYEKVYSRHFTFAPFGGFDGWDIYRTKRTNTDTYALGGAKSTLGLASTSIETKTLSDAEAGTTSDYYAYYEGIKAFKNPEETNINVFATPGIDLYDNIGLVDTAIEMVEEERCDSIYLITSPDLDVDGDVITAEDAVDNLELAGIDSNYSATYWPWIQVNDTENNVLIYLPPTRDVVRNIALTDNIAFPWFAVAGVQRGDVQAEKARKKLTLEERDTLYEARINPIATFSQEGIKIWGNKTLQVKESALDRLNVRRLLLQARKLISAVSIRLLFEQNDEIVRNQFKSLVNPILESIRSERGLTDFRVEVDSSPESIDRNELAGKIFIKPTRALEFITIEFVVMSTGASFEDVEKKLDISGKNSFPVYLLLNKEIKLKK